MTWRVCISKLTRCTFQVREILVEERGRAERTKVFAEGRSNLHPGVLLEKSGMTVNFWRK